MRKVCRPTGYWAAAVMLCGLSAALSAQSLPKDYPNKRIRIVVPFAAGGSKPGEFAKYVAQDVAFMRDLARKIEATAK